MYKMVDAFIICFEMEWFISGMELHKGRPLDY
jgi:hypothetical protein